MLPFPCSDRTVEVLTVLSRRAGGALRPNPCGDGTVGALTVLSRRVRETGKMLKFVA